MAIPKDPKEAAHAFTPAGRLRASINLGNPILASREAASGQPVGVSIDLARAFAERLGVECDLVVFDTAAKSVDAVTQGQADIGFFAIDPLRGQGIAFTAPYVLIEGSYLVHRVHRCSRTMRWTATAIVWPLARAVPTTCSSAASSSRRLLFVQHPHLQSLTHFWRKAWTWPQVCANNWSPMPNGFPACGFCPAGSW